MIAVGTPLERHSFKNNDGFLACNTQCLKGASQLGPLLQTWAEISGQSKPLAAGVDAAATAWGFLAREQVGGGPVTLGTQSWKSVLYL